MLLKFENNPCLLLLFMVSLLYGRVVTFGYVNDDYTLVNISSFSQAWNMAFEPSALHVRPVWFLSYYFSNLFFQRPWFDHAINVALFGLCVVLAYEYAKRNMGQRKALAAALIWILVPWNAFPATWIAQRNDLLANAFALTALLLLDKSPFVSLPCAAGAVFSKVTVMFLPAFLGWVSFRRKARVLAAFFFGLFVVYFALAGLAYHNNIDQLYKVHGSAFSGFLIPFNYAFHFIEVVFCQVVPLPFFVGWWHGLMWFSGLVLLITSCRWQFNRIESVKYLLLGVLMMLPAMVSSELRVVGFSTLFFILFVIQSISTIKYYPRFAFAVVLLEISALLMIFLTQEHFHSLAMNPNEPIPWGQDFYQNSYYKVKREWIIVVISWLRHLVK